MDGGVGMHHTVLTVLRCSLVPRLWWWAVEVRRMSVRPGIPGGRNWEYINMDIAMGLDIAPATHYIRTSVMSLLAGADDVLVEL